MTDIKYMTITLKSPMQSWGFNSQFNIRGTFNFPTKSAIVGILAAAIGIDRNDTESLKNLADIKITILRINPGIMLEDYQTVGGGHKNKKFKVMTTTKKFLKDPKIIKKYYLYDAQFIVICEGKSKTIQTCSDALKNPIYNIFLGRKSCLPSIPIFGNIISKNDLKNLLKQIKAIDVISDSVYNQSTDAIKDTPIDFLKRSFNTRFIKYETFNNFNYQFS